MATSKTSSPEKLPRGRSLAKMERLRPDLPWGNMESMHRYLWVQCAGADPRAVLEGRQLDIQHGLPQGSFRIYLIMMAREGRAKSVMKHRHQNYQWRLVDPDRFERSQIKKLGQDVPHLPLLW